VTITIFLYQVWYTRNR